jgi:hypothetical protein
MVDSSKESTFSVMATFNRKDTYAQFAPLKFYPIFHLYDLERFSEDPSYISFLARVLSRGCSEWMIHGGSRSVRAGFERKPKTEEANYIKSPELWESSYA